MQLWRQAWYPGAPNYPVGPIPGGDPNSTSGLQRLGIDEIEAMLMHHGAALIMAPDCLSNSSQAEGSEAQEHQHHQHK